MYLSTGTVRPCPLFVFKCVSYMLLPGGDWTRGSGRGQTDGAPPAVTTCLSRYGLPRSVITSVFQTYTSYVIFNFCAFEFRRKHLTS